MNSGRIVFAINEADLQTVALECFGKILTDTEIRSVEKKLKSGRYIDWEHPVQVATLEAISSSNQKVYDEFDSFILAD